MGAGVNYCFDELEYRNGNIVCSGWAVPEIPGGPLSVAVYDKSGAKKDAEISPVSRADVGVSMFGDSTMDMYGFRIRLPYAKEESLTVRFEVDNEKKETLDAEIFPKKLHFRFVKQTSLPGKLKRYLKSDDKKNFWRTDRYFTYEKKDKEYAVWREFHSPDKKELERQRTTPLGEQPLISIVMPVYRPNLVYLKQMIESIHVQTYGNWELCIACGGKLETETYRYLNGLNSMGRRVKVKFLKENLGIAGNTNKAIEMAAGEWIAFVDQDDLLRADALYEYARAIHMNCADVVYCDEDKLDEDTGIFFEPNFKPDFNPDLLLCNNYICHMLMVRLSLARKVGELDETLSGAQDHDFILRCMEKTDLFVHIPKVLYSWRRHRESTALCPESKEYAYEAGKKAIEGYYRRNGIPGSVEPMKWKGWYRTSFMLQEHPSVSIIIPNKDHKEELERCVESLLTGITYQNFEILIVENNSEKQETFEFYETLKQKDARIRVEVWDRPFNYSAINNFAAAKASGEYLLLLNNDTKAISPDFLESMLGYCMRPDVGAVGAKLYYPDDTIQHAGVLVGVSEGADHVFLHYHKSNPGYMGRAAVSQDMSAVTAACMMVKKSVYETVGGMEEAFAVAYNDVDFCLKVRKAGYLVVYDAFAELYHYESATRGYEENEEKKERFEAEKALLRRRWPVQMLGDPYYNRNLSLKHGYFSI